MRYILKLVAVVAIGPLGTTASAQRGTVGDKTLPNESPLPLLS